jgi:mRNA interferase YafQ
MNVEYTGSFKKDMKRLQKRSVKSYNKVKRFIDDYFVYGNAKIPTEFTPHKLSGNYKSHWECHIESDTLLIWINRNTDTVVMVRCGTHSDLFK